MNVYYYTAKLQLNHIKQIFPFWTLVWNYYYFIGFNDPSSFLWLFSLLLKELIFYYFFCPFQENNHIRKEQTWKVSNILTVVTFLWLLIFKYTERQKSCTTKKIVMFRIWKYMNSLQVMWNKTMPISPYVFKRESLKQSNEWSVTRETGNMG